MALKTIAHALFSWTENGTARMATHGQTVDIDDDVIATYERFGVFEAEEADSPEPDSTEAAAATPPSLDRPEEKQEQADLAAPAVVTAERPRNVAPESVWQDYARERGLDPDGMTKDEIIAAFTEQENKTNG
ncbi:hypothetical protein [Rhodococcus sp. KRD162]|uniref:hypothetical protein n=1 Tax=Rhodococcus sp. KRD162 TaxID=2729725 RepID=UPI0019CFC08F|nr:hypothetical protein [Rhodococcus sp. KRD162]